MRNFKSNVAGSDNDSENLNEDIYLLLINNGFEIDPDAKDFIIQRVISYIQDLGDDEVLDLEVLEIVRTNEEEIFNPIGSIAWKELQ